MVPGIFGGGGGSWKTSKKSCAAKGRANFVSVFSKFCKFTFHFFQDLLKWLVQNLEHQGKNRFAKFWSGECNPHQEHPWYLVSKELFGDTPNSVNLHTNWKTELFVLGLLNRNTFLRLFGFDYKKLINKLIYLMKSKLQKKIYVN